jgi:hypothetical protein
MLSCSSSRSLDPKRTAAAKVMPFTPQHFEPKCSGDATLAGRRNHPPRSVSLIISTRPTAGSGRHRNSARRPEDTLFKNIGPLIPWNQLLSLSGPPPPCSYFMCPMLTGTLCTLNRRPTDRLPGTPCCPAVCVPGSLLHVAPLPGVCTHGTAARPAVILAVPLRHDFLGSSGERPFPLDWRPSGHSRLLSSRIL